MTDKKGVKKSTREIGTSTKSTREKGTSRLPKDYRPIREINVKRKNYRDFREKD